VKDGKLIYPKLDILPPDPWKYRDAHMKLRNLLRTYTDNVIPKSIDEFILNMEGCPAFRHGIHNVGREVKARIKKEIGDWITVSVGIAPNRFLAKTAERRPSGKQGYLHGYRLLPIRCSYTKGCFSVHKRILLVSAPARLGNR